MQEDCKYGEKCLRLDCRYKHNIVKKNVPCVHFQGRGCIRGEDRCPYLHIAKVSRPIGQAVEDSASAGMTLTQEPEEKPSLAEVEKSQTIKDPSEFQIEKNEFKIEEAFIPTRKNLEKTEKPGKTEKKLIEEPIEKDPKNTSLVPGKKPDQNSKIKIPAKSNLAIPASKKADPPVKLLPANNPEEKIINIIRSETVNLPQMKKSLDENSTKILTLEEIRQKKRIDAQLKEKNAKTSPKAKTAQKTGEKILDDKKNKEKGKTGKIINKQLSGEAEMPVKRRSSATNLAEKRMKFKEIERTVSLPCVAERGAEVVQDVEMGVVMDEKGGVDKEKMSFESGYFLIDENFIREEEKKNTGVNKSQEKELEKKEEIRLDELISEGLTGNADSDNMVIDVATENNAKDLIVVDINQSGGDEPDRRDVDLLNFSQDLSDRNEMTEKKDLDFNDFSGSSRPEKNLSQTLDNNSAVTKISPKVIPLLTTKEEWLPYKEILTSLSFSSLPDDDLNACKSLAESLSTPEGVSQIVYDLELKLVSFPDPQDPYFESLSLYDKIEKLYQILFN